MLVVVLTLIVSSVLVFFYCGYFLFGRRMSREVNYAVDGFDYFPIVSLVVATYNEEDIIREKIDNIRSLDYPIERLEIIFVDSSTDGTRGIIRSWVEEGSFNVRLIEESSRKGLATALNIGYAAAKGEVVVKNDADITLDRLALKELVKYFGNPHIGAVTGALRITSSSKLEQGYKSIYSKLRLAEANLDSTYIFEPFSAFRKALIAPLDARSVADDCEIALKIRKSGYKTVYSPTAVAFDECPAGLKDRLRQKSRRAQGHIRLLLQNLGLLFNSRYGRFGWIVFPANFFMMIISPWLFLSLVPLGFLFLSELFGVYSASGLFVFGILSVAFIYVKSIPRTLAGFLEAQLSLIVSFFKLALNGPDFMWTKEKRT
ncbi:MAG: glycosyltransferase [Candidatus Bathyarchaeota archaeon]|nr:glycosyltransferase [Candidatus Bathyarchaeota archaeon]